MHLIRHTLIEHALTVALKSSVGLPPISDSEHANSLHIWQSAFEHVNPEMAVALAWYLKFDRQHPGFFKKQLLVPRVGSNVQAEQNWPLTSHSSMQAFGVGAIKPCPPNGAAVSKRTIAIPGKNWSVGSGLIGLPTKKWYLSPSNIICRIYSIYVLIGSHACSEYDNVYDHKSVSSGANADGWMSLQPLSSAAT